MKTSRLSQPVAEVEEILGLRAALAEERQQEAAFMSVFTRAEAANYAWATARAYRTNLVQRSAAGEPIDPAEIVKAEADIADAHAAAATFPDIIAMAERAVAKARNAVAGALRGEMRRRHQLAQIAYDNAVQHVIDAAQDRTRTWEELQNATAAVNLPLDNLRNLLSEEIDKVS